MDQFQVTPPEKFTFKAEDWPKWIRSFDTFRVASGLESEAEENQVDALIFTMGQQAEDILASLHLSDEEVSAYDTVKAVLEAYFISPRNVVLERAVFNRRQQEDGEPVDSFVAALHRLAEHCGFGVLHDQMVRDRLVAGLRDKRLSQQLQLDPELTLEKAATKARHSEQEKKQHDQGGVVHTQQGGGAREEPGQPRSGPGARKLQYIMCKRCGGKKHYLKRCPAVDIWCNHCNKKGHYPVMCSSKGEVNPAAVQAALAGGLPVAFLGSMSDDDRPVMTMLKVDNHSIVFRIDTCADVTAVPRRIYDKGHFGRLVMAACLLKGPGGKPLAVVGMFKATLSRRGRTEKENIYVVDGLRTPQLSLRAAKALQLIAELI